MAEALVQLAELVEPVAELAQEWIEAKDDDDHAAIVEARDRLLAGLDESPDLTATMSRLLPLLVSTPSPLTTRSTQFDARGVFTRC
jgi:hypothetical protein